MVNDYINIIEIFDKKQKMYPNISIFYFCFWMKRVYLISYVHGTCQLFLSQNNASSFPNKLTPTDSANNVIALSDNPTYNVTLFICHCHHIYVELVSWYDLLFLYVIDAAATVTVHGGTLYCKIST